MDEWYQGIRKSDKYSTNAVQWLDKDLVKGYKTDNEQRELYHAISNRLGPLAGDGDYINRCTDNKCTRAEDKNILRVDKAMRTALNIDARIAQYSPDVTFVRVLMGGKPENDRAYTIIYNKAYKSVSNMMQTEKMGDPRDYEYDTQTILPWLEGSYPDFFYVIKEFPFNRLLI